MCWWAGNGPNMQTQTQNAALFTDRTITKTKLGNAKATHKETQGGAHNYEGDTDLHTQTEGRDTSGDPIN